MATEMAGRSPQPQSPATERPEPESGRTRPEFGPLASDADYEGDRQEMSTTIDSSSQDEAELEHEQGPHLMPDASNPAAADPPPAEPVDQPMDEEFLTRAAREAAEAGEFRRAVGIYRELLGLVPNNLSARNNLALVLDQLGDREVALTELDRCLRQDADNVHVLVNRGGIMGALGRHAEAERDLSAALKLDPGNAEAHYNLGLVTIRRGLWGEAVTSLKRAIELDSSLASAYFYLGEALNHIDDLPGALQAYQQATELQPTNAQAFYGIGIILDRMNRPDDAAQMYRRSREIAGR
jgi:tetratricopeptide (TPR) repeat protein